MGKLIGAMIALLTRRWRRREGLDKAQAEIELALLQGWIKLRLGDLFSPLDDKQSKHINHKER